MASAAFNFGDLDQVFSNQRPRKRCPEQILTLVHRAGLQSRKHEVPQEFFPQIRM